MGSFCVNSEKRGFGLRVVIVRMEMRGLIREIFREFGKFMLGDGIEDGFCFEWICVLLIIL